MPLFLFSTNRQILYLYMMIRKELIGTTIYVKELDREVVISEDNVELLKALKIDCFGKDNTRTSEYGSRNRKRKKNDQ